MGSLQTVLPFKLAATDESLTAYGGLALVGEYLRAMGVGELLDIDATQIVARNVFHSHSEMALIAAFTDGEIAETVHCMNMKP